MTRKRRIRRNRAKFPPDKKGKKTVRFVVVLEPSGGWGTTFWERHQTFDEALYEALYDGDLTTSDGPHVAYVVEATLDLPKPHAPKRAGRKVTKVDPKKVLDQIAKIKSEEIA